MWQRIVRKPSDIAFSNYIRTRDKWTCQRCGKVYPEHSQGIHAAHIFSRIKKSTRWVEKNALALCYGCHSWGGTHSREFYAWIAKRMGTEEFEKLHLSSNLPAHDIDEKAIEIAYIQKLKSIKTLIISVPKPK